MKTLIIQPKQNQAKKPMGRFATLDEYVKFKTDIANKMLAKIDRNVLENLGK